MMELLVLLLFLLLTEEEERSRWAVSIPVRNSTLRPSLAPGDRRRSPALTDKLVLLRGGSQLAFQPAAQSFTVFKCRYVCVRGRKGRRGEGGGNQNIKV